MSGASSGQSVVDALGFNIEPAKHARDDLALGPRAYERDSHNKLARQPADTTTVGCLELEMSGSVESLRIGFGIEAEVTRVGGTLDFHLLDPGQSLCAYKSAGHRIQVSDELVTEAYYRSLVVSTALKDFRFPHIRQSQLLVELRIGQHGGHLVRRAIESVFGLKTHLRQV